ncbi:hypothetical protein D3C72_2272060 [compost metagenome]
MGEGLGIHELKGPLALEKGGGRPVREQGAAHQAVRGFVELEVERAQLDRNHQGPPLARKDRVLGPGEGGKGGIAAHSQDA